MTATSCQIMFYHLEHSRLEQALPQLLEKCMERDWLVVVQVGSRERMEALDAHLWTYRDESFLPHSVASNDDMDSLQPILLTDDGRNSNAATIRFCVDHAVPPDDISAYERLILMFSGDDPEALAHARTYWKEAKGGGHDVTYWRQSARGQWEKKA